MPKYNNKFKETTYYEHEILTQDGAKVGTLRVKPSNILWKDVSQQEFRNVSLSDFQKWINEKGEKTSS